MPVLLRPIPVRPLALILAAAAVCGHAAAQPVCEQALQAHVVRIEITPPDPAAPQTASGVIVSNSGLVLSDYRMLETAGVLPNNLLNRDQIEAVTFAIPHRLDAEGNPMQAQLIGFDWRRNLILLKMPPIDPNETELKEAPLARAPVRHQELVCPVGYVQEGAGYSARVASDPLTATIGTGIYRSLARDANAFPNSQYGGPVLRGAPPHDLVGMLVYSPNGSPQRFLPIEYADTLLSQLFISRIARDVDEFRSISKEMRTRFSWGFQILKNDPYNGDDRNQITDLKIRFFATPHVTLSAPLANRRLLSFKSNATYKGTSLNSDGVEQDDAQSFSQEYEIKGTDDGYYFDFQGSGNISDLRKGGFKTIDSVTITFFPVYGVGRSRVEEKDLIRKFDIPLRIE